MQTATRVGVILLPQVVGMRVLTTYILRMRRDSRSARSRCPLQ